MKLIYKFLLLTVISNLLLIFSAKAQNPEWIVYNPGNSTLPGLHVTSIVIDHSNLKWIATQSGGISTFDDKTWAFHGSATIGFMCSIETMLVDNKGHLWASSFYCSPLGLVEWDGNKWISYSPKNTNLPHYYSTAYSFISDKNGNIYYGSIDLYYVKYDGISWTVDKDSSAIVGAGEVIHAMAFDSSNNIWLGTNDGFSSDSYGILLTKQNNKWTSYIPDYNIKDYTKYGSINSLAIDKNQNKWIGKGDSGGLIKFDDKNWTEYSTSNSGLPHDNIYAITIDRFNNKWVGTEAGLVKYNDTTWTVYNKTNSGLPNNYITAIIIDKYDNKWIGTYYGGLAVFREGGVILGVEDGIKSEGIKISPNPSFDYIEISGLNPRVNPTVDDNIGIYNILGVKVLFVGVQNLESQRIDVSTLHSGLYYCSFSYGVNKITQSFIVMK